MGKTCAVFGCRSGYRKRQGEDDSLTAEKLSFYSFPLHDHDLCSKWIKATLRQGFQATVHSRICSKHFTETDFITDSHDTNQRRRKSKSSEKLERRYLNPSAVPTVFDKIDILQSSLPNTSSTQNRSGKATSSNRLQRELSCWKS
jgi:hypothetical protein